MKRSATWICLLIVILVGGPLHGQEISQQHEMMLKEEIHTIAHKADFSDSDWKAVSPLLKNKRLVMLGEYNHGSKEVLEVRTNLIKYLHEKLGIKAILFESGIGELLFVDVNKQNLTSTQMTYGLFGGWRTRESEELMAYIQSKNISLAGFDVQRTGGSFDKILRDVASRNAIDSTNYHYLEERYGIISRELTNRKVVYDSIATKTIALIQDYQTFHDKLQDVADTSKMTQFSLITLQNRIKYLTYMLEFVKDKDWNKRWAARDAAMAANIQWLSENVYEDEPMVVIGHNYHIAKYNEKESTMGEILSRKYGKSMYALGVFAGGGSYHDNAGKVQQMQLPDSIGLDIKHIISKLKGTVNFLDISANSKHENSWFHNEITINDTFINLDADNKMNLSQYFDGLLLLDKVTPTSQ